MITLNTALILIAIHLIYYAIFWLFSDILRYGMVKNTPNKIITKLRSQYKVKLLTFQKNNNHDGFAWFKTIYLNESLFRRPKDLYSTFYHELFHVQQKHKRNTLLFRLLFAALPILLIIHWGVFTVIYISFAWFLYKYNEHCEKGANEYAHKMIKDV
jgi:hypothetical protein